MTNIRRCRLNELDKLHHIINQAARAYEGEIPDDCYGNPYMPMDELKAEFSHIQFYGWEEDGQLIGLMGFEPVKDVTLIRHAYVLPEHQRKGIASRLMDFLKKKVNNRRLLVGTWKDAWWAIKFYEKHGFKLLPTNELLNVYWKIPKRQVETSIVMEME